MDLGKFDGEEYGEHNGGSLMGISNIFATQSDVFLVGESYDRVCQKCHYKSIASLVDLQGESHNLTEYIIYMHGSNCKLFPVPTI